MRGVERYDLPHHLAVHELDANSIEVVSGHGLVRHFLILESIIMKDSLLLLICAVLVAVASWCFLHYAGASAFDVLTLVAMLALFFENLRLRRKLRKRSA